MLSSVLRSERAVQVNIEIMRAFVRLRAVAASYRRLAREVRALEERYDERFRIVFRAIRTLLRTSRRRRRPIGFSAGG